MHIYKDKEFTVINGEGNLLLSKNPNWCKIASEVDGVSLEYFWIMPVVSSIKGKLCASYKALKYIWTDVRTPYGKR